MNANCSCRAALPNSVLPRRGAISSCLPAEPDLHGSWNGREGALPSLPTGKRERAGTAAGVTALPHA